MNINKGELLKLSNNDINNYIVVVSEVYNKYIICKKLYSTMPYTSQRIFYNYKDEMNIIKDNVYIIDEINKAVKLKKNKFHYLDDIRDMEPLKIYKSQVQLII
jgi:hypothetical protein